MFWPGRVTPAGPVLKKKNGRERCYYYYNHISAPGMSWEQQVHVQGNAMNRAVVSHWLQAYMGERRHFLQSCPSPPAPSQKGKETAAGAESEATPSQEPPPEEEPDFIAVPGDTSSDEAEAMDVSIPGSPQDPSPDFIAVPPAPVAARGPVGRR